MRRTIEEALAEWLAAGGSHIGQIIIRKEGEAWMLRHVDDKDADSQTLRRLDSPEALREMAKWDAAETYRPLRTAPNLTRGWEARLSSPAELRLALDFLYPAAVANWLRWIDGEAEACSLRDTFNRQTGMYRVTGLIRSEEAEELVTTACADANCLRKVLWKLDADTGWRGFHEGKVSAPRHQPGVGAEIPLLCLDLCPLLLGAARETVKKRMKKESDAAKAAEQEAAAPSNS
jgi:sirohydrochlorin cobaltochelatase